MGRMKAACILVILAQVLVGCGVPRPIRSVAETTSLDDRMSCAHLQGELSANEARMREVGVAEARRPSDNVNHVIVHGALGALVRDNGRSNRVETATLERRNQRLRLLMAQRGCTI